MKLSEFIALSEEEKRAVVLQDGVAIAKRDLPDYMVFLFQLSHFYVETFCSHKSKEIMEYRVIYNTKHLTPYLETISIDHLLKS
ncbi:MAG TPA: hypothetical protein PKD42_15570 [Chitinophagaceae bacterium]|nr:hypothetical protein [Chitinophagaceae bacterium]